MFPKLIGKDAKFIAAELKKFKAKTRKAPFPIAAKELIEDKQIDEVAAFLGNLK